MCLGFFFGRHLAIGRHHRWIPRHPHGLQFDRVKVFLADHMHTSSGIYRKLSCFWLFSWCNRQYPFFRGRVECSLLFLMFLSRFHALLWAHRCCLSVSSWDHSSNFTACWLRWWGILTCIFPSDGPLFSRILAWRSVDCVNRTRRIGPKTYGIKFFPHCMPLWESSDYESCETQPNCGTIFTLAIACLSSLFLPFCEL